jgi:hypothetical protein
MNTNESGAARDRRWLFLRIRHESGVFGEQITGQQLPQWLRARD